MLKATAKKSGNIVGIDPGFSGAICILDSEGKILLLTDMPIVKADKTELDESAIRRILEGSEVSHVYLEKSQTMPGQGISSSGRYMMSYGIIRGICVGLQIPYTLIQPQCWKKVMMEGMGKEKAASIVRAQQLYPIIELSRKKDHGMADAYLIAEYGRTKT